jgi:hypothetical protein
VALGVPVSAASAFAPSAFASMLAATTPAVVASRCAPTFASPVGLAPSIARSLLASMAAVV